MSEPLLTADAHLRRDDAARGDAPRKVVDVAVGVLIGAGLMGERYPAQVWWGTGLIAVGIGLTVQARRRGD